MILALINHKFLYETENVCRIFYPLEDISVISDYPAQGEYILSEIAENEGNTVARAALSFDEDFTYEISLAKNAGDKQKELSLAQCLYRVLSRKLNYSPPWGILTGVRPEKLMRFLTDTNGKHEAVSYFKNELFVKDEKIKLACDIYDIQSHIINSSGKNSFSLYMSIPFCPTRCSYCSFVSHSVAGAKKLIPEYIRLLCEEIAYTAEIARRLSLKLETVYFGGGTPTVLTAYELETILSALSQSFGGMMRGVREYTVEAGRPDTVTLEKLEALKKNGVNRVSINPQTFSQEILDNIGRKHTVAQTLEAFGLARKVGFDNINMDFIAGLPGETDEVFLEGINKGISLSAESITVHAMALKRSAEIVTEGRQHSVFLQKDNKNERADCKNTDSKTDMAMTALTSTGYKPYYMYRQSRSLGNLENIGYSKPGFESLYNVYMMEEIHTVLSCGAGAVTKLKSPVSAYIERIFNFKYPYEYIDRFEEVLSRKERIVKFYGEHQ